MIRVVSKGIALLFAVAVLLTPSFTSGITNYREPTPEVIYQVDKSHPPFEFSLGNEVYGFGLDLGRMIFSSGDFNVIYSADTWSNVYQRIVTGEIDICGLLAITEERKKELLFTKPVVRTYRAVYAKRNTRLENIEDIAQYRIGVQKSDYAETILKNELGINNYFTFNDLDECIHALESGSIDVVFGNQEVTNYLLVKYQLSEELTPHIINLYPTALAFGVSKTRPELVSFMNGQLDKLQKSGFYEQSYQKYFYRHSEYYRSTHQKMTVFLVFFLLLAILVAILIANVIIKQLRRMVDKATNSLKKEHELLRITLSSIGDGVMAVNAQGRVTFMNHVAERLTGFYEKDCLDRPLDEVLNIVDTDNGMRYEVPIGEVLEKGNAINFNNLNILISEGGSQHLILGSAAPIKNDADEVIGVLVAFQDISEKKQAEETIRYHEYYDSLTDLPNRKLFHEYLNNALESADRNSCKLAVLIIDLDYFKNINDALGHNIGDKLLQEASRRLVKMLDDNEVLARMGGDEFTILMPQVNGLEEACALAHKATEVLGCSYMIDNHELYITASVGIAVYPDDGSEASIIMKHADTALYNAKENGRNTYRSYEMLDDEKLANRFALTKDLRSAIERNEMLLYYQPKIDGNTGTIAGMEALIRWNHPDKGLISPGVFIPLAEETGLISRLDTWVLKTACMQFNSLKAIYNKSLRLSVNLSAYQFRNHSLVETVAQILEETGFNPAELELEITETTAMENIDFTIKTLRRLNEMGVNISMDDFGTGYSSLSYLRHFPIHILKIDRSFISDMENDHNTRTIVKSIIDVAHSLRLKVTAEGVETAEQLSMLKEMNCDEIQGFLISKPLPLMDLRNNIMPDMA